MTLADLVAILGLVAMAVVYVVFRLGERGGCPSCGGPGGSCASSSSDDCARGGGETDRTEEVPGPGSGRTTETSPTPPRSGRRGR